MAQSTLSERSLTRLSLEKTLPALGGVIALALCTIFLIASLTAVHWRADTASQARLELLAELIGDDVGEGDRRAVLNTVKLVTDLPVTITHNNGNVVYGADYSPAVTAAYQVPVRRYDGATVGQMRAAALVPPKLPLPIWAIVLLFIMSIGSGMWFGRWVGATISRSIDDLSQTIKTLRSGERVEIRHNLLSRFTEMRFLQTALHRALVATQRELFELRDVAYVNPDGGLPNYTALLRTLDGHLRNTTFDHPLAVLRFEIDEYDNACESLGHNLAAKLGPAVIARVQEELLSEHEDGTPRFPEAFLAQPRQDGLVLILPNQTGRADASAVARALRSAFVAPFMVGEFKIKLDISGGIVLAPEDGTRSDELLRRAETALRSVREQSKRGFCFYAPRLDRVAMGRVQLETEMRDGIAKGEFKPYFQPKIDFRTGRLRGCEALARWQRPGGGSVSPAAFIPVAEESGLIDQIGTDILKQACVAAAGWLRRGMAISVAVNVSPLQLGNPNFRQDVMEALTSSGLPPKFLELEITESVAIEDPKAFENVLAPLRAIGVRLAVDDFGTGHSNLAILSRLKFDVFKIDRQFIKSLERDDSATPIVEMILAMAASLGLETVAEGVETGPQARFLRERGCSYAQGFLYSAPLPEQDFLAFAASWEARRRTRAGKASASA